MVVICSSVRGLERSSSSIIFFTLRFNSKSGVPPPNGPWTAAFAVEAQSGDGFGRGRGHPALAGRRTFAARGFGTRGGFAGAVAAVDGERPDRKSTRLNSSHLGI